MSKGKYARSRSTKVDKKFAVVIIVLTAVLVLLLMALLLLRHMERNGQQNTEPTAEQGTTNPAQTGPEQSGQSGQPEQTDTQPPVTVPERIEGDYEQWLAAGMVLAASIEYPDLEIQGVYIASKTAQFQKQLSEGAYIHLISGGEEILIQSLPLEEERTEAGTSDLYTMDLGFATFDRVALDSVDLDAMIQLQLEDLTEMIRQTMLPSVYSR